MHYNQHRASFRCKNETFLTSSFYCVECVCMYIFQELLLEIIITIYCVAHLTQHSFLSACRRMNDGFIKWMQTLLANVSDTKLWVFAFYTKNFQQNQGRDEHSFCFLGKVLQVTHSMWHNFVYILRKTKESFKHFM